MSKPSTKNIVIIAPHVDDEVIGCWSILNSGRVRGVLYVDELAPIRLTEARACAKRFDFEILDGYSILYADDILYVPSITDKHPTHRAANLWYRDSPNTKFFYSVDLNLPTKKKVPHWFDKRAALDELFPSQKDLWGTNANCYLFEDIQEKDYTTLKPTTVYVEDIGINVLAYSSMPVDVRAFATIDKLVTHLLKLSPYFRITLPDGTTHENRN